MFTVTRPFNVPANRAMLRALILFLRGIPREFRQRAADVLVRQPFSLILAAVSIGNVLVWLVLFWLLVWKP